jgi:hypothetical protein
MNQTQLDLIGTRLGEVLQQYNEGLITIVELLDFAVMIRGDRTVCYESVAGLIDPITGLRYPSQAELAAVDIQFDAAPQPEQPITPVVDAVRRHMTSHQTNGENWPDDAEYYVQYRVKAWPTDYTSHTAFFTSKSAMREWYVAKIDWTLLEDNYFEVDAVYRWDLGPNLLSSTNIHLL